MEDLTRRTARAVRWRFAGTVSSAALQFAVGVLLARLLPPSDFGIVALASVVIGMMKPLSDLGAAAALVQKPELAGRHVRAAFTLTVVLGLAVGAAIVAGAPLAANALREPKAIPILRALSIGLVFRSLGSVAEALLARRLEFRKLVFIESGTSLIAYGGVAVVLALSGYGAWSLVWASVLQAALASSAQLIVVRHSMQPVFETRDFGDLLPFGIGASLGTWVNYLALNGDNFVVGRWMGTTSLGLYAAAYALMNLPFTYASAVFSGVLFPAFAQVQQQPERLQRAFLVATRLTALVAAPAMATLGVAAPHLVPGVFGDPWRGAVAPLQILCIAGYFRALYHLGGVAIRSVGRVYRELALQVVYATLVIGGTIVASPYGLPWVAAAVSGAIAYMFVATSASALKATRTTWATYAGAQRPALILGGVTLVVAVGVRLTLEAIGASPFTTALAILGAAAVPWSIGVLRAFRDPELEQVRALLPAWATWLTAATR